MSEIELIVLTELIEGLRSRGQFWDVRGPGEPAGPEIAKLLEAFRCARRKLIQEQPTQTYSEAQ